MMIATMPALAAQPVAPGTEPAAGFGQEQGRVTGLKVPRFVSLKSDRARMRVGPSTDYPASYVYTSRGLPLEILEEWSNWRQVRDDEGTTGWMHVGLLSGRRTAVVAPWLKTDAPLRTRPSSDATVVASMQPGVLVNIGHCSGRWCRVSVMHQSARGYVNQTKLWGVYPNEVVE